MKNNRKNRKLLFIRWKNRQYVMPINAPLKFDVNNKITIHTENYFENLNPD